MWEYLTKLLQSNEQHHNVQYICAQITNVVSFYVDFLHLKKISANYWIKRKDLLFLNGGEQIK